MAGSKSNSRTRLTLKLNTPEYPMAKFVIYKDTAGQYRWRLRAANNEIIAVSEAYITKQGTEHSIYLVKALAQSADVVDLTTSG